MVTANRSMVRPTFQQRVKARIAAIDGPEKITARNASLVIMADKRGDGLRASYPKELIQMAVHLDGHGPRKARSNGMALVVTICSGFAVIAGLLASAFGGK
jgi:hypothetical protein